MADLAGYTLGDWGFTPSQVAADVLLAYGADDERVPPAHGEWYRDRLPSAELQLWPGVGHLVVVPAWGGCWSSCEGEGIVNSANADSGTCPKGEGRLARATLMQLRRS